MSGLPSSSWPCPWPPRRPNGGAGWWAWWDGDSLIIFCCRRPIDVRLTGIDAPEHNQPYGEESKALASDLCLNQRVRVIAHGWDRYGRTLAEVIFPDGRNLNYEIVRAGAAWWYRRYATKDKTLARLAKEAKSAGRGLWGQNAVALWDWRRP